MTGDDNRFLNMIAAIADGQPIDWSRVESTAANESDRQLLKTLRLLAAIGAAREAPDHAASARDIAHEDTDRVHPVPTPRLLRARLNAARLSLERWGKLEVLERVGEGAFGEVYRAFDSELDREVALKLFWPSPSMHEAEQSRALQEARSLASVRHPNVAAVYGIEAHNGRLGVWMEFIRGHTLAELMELQGRMSFSEAALVGIQVCDALAAVHAVGYLHLDVKTQNVMREEGGRLVLTDFGAARALGDMTRSVGGSPLYMAPELLRGATPTVQCDCYSTGVLLFKLVTDTYPLRGTSFDDLRKAHAGAKPVRIADLRADVPEAFVTVVEGALNPEPEKRFATIRDLRAELQRVLQEPRILSLPSNSEAEKAPVHNSLEPGIPGRRINVFVSYCHQDSRLVERLGILTYLKDLESESCEVWSDHKISTGDDWSEVLVDRLRGSQILVALVTQSFLRSRYCQEVEIREFLSRRLKEGLVVFPIIISPCEWQRYEWLRTLQFLPREGTMTTTYKGRGRKEEFMVRALSELRAIAEGIAARW